MAGGDMRELDRLIYSERVTGYTSMTAFNLRITGIVEVSPTNHQQSTGDFDG
jgi:hypothetical protein